MSNRRQAGEQCVIHTNYDGHVLLPQTRLIEIYRNSQHLVQFNQDIHFTDIYQG